MSHIEPLRLQKKDQYSYYIYELALCMGAGLGHLVLHILWSCDVSVSEKNEQTLSNCAWDSRYVTNRESHEIKSRQISF